MCYGSQKNTLKKLENVGPDCYNTRMTNWRKYSFACDPDECDTLIEVTVGPFDWPNGVVQFTCPCGRVMQWLSVEDATIPPMNERNQMETTEKDAMVSMWRQELELTYGNQITELQNKLSASEQQTENYRQLVSNANSQLGKIIDNLTAEHWYNPNTEKSEVLEELCEILDHEPKQDISITATITVNVTYACPLEEVEDFDARYFLQDVLTVDAYNGDVIVDAFDVEDADVDWS